MKVGVALSGGKDSSLVAALLQKKGYEVVGYHLQLCPDEYSIRPLEDQLSTIRELCEYLNIDLKVIDARNDFRRKIIETLIKSYQRGETPNPCILCNRLFKFGLLLDIARQDGCDMVASGHYARIVRNAHILLKRPRDPEKDETYFLFELTTEQLDFITFPLGDLELDNLVKLRDELLPNFVPQPITQEACFLSRLGLKQFLEDNLGPADHPGDIIDKYGRKLGEHPGYQFYTIGQRKGLSSASGKKGPLYVLRIIPEKNQVMVGDKEDLTFKRLLAVKPNWVSISPPKKTIRLKSKIRYTHPESDSLVTQLPEGDVMVEFFGSQESATPGQAVVFYRNNILLGGAWIEKVL